jgi:hypothetical protein
MWKKLEDPDRPQMRIWRMRVSCWIPKATNTHSEYSIFIASSRKNICKNSPHCYVTCALSVLFVLGDTRRLNGEMKYTGCISKNACTNLRREFVTPTEEKIVSIIISLYSIILSDFVTESDCLLRVTNWVLQSDGYSFVLKGLNVTRSSQLAKTNESVAWHQTLWRCNVSHFLKPDVSTAISLN